MGDLISRNAILKHIEKIRQDALMMGDIRRASIIMNGMDLCEKAVKNQPSAQPKRMRGRWVEHKWAEEVAGMLISNYACSCCSSWERINSDFCPNCGADMRG